ncbi:MAG TPA: hypothetical protein VKY26_10575 [Actinomycetota bacterium]|nr:hypothetical protein [Actinomycetota bacterium]
MKIRFTKAARRHRIGRASVRTVMAATTPSLVTTSQGKDAWLYIGPDERNRELEIIAVEVEAGEDHEVFLLVICVLPTQLRKR